MATRRMLSKDISTSEKLKQLEIIGNSKKNKEKKGEFFQLLYTWMIPHADDFGRMSATPYSIKMTVMPGSDRKLEDFEEALNAMHTVGLIQLYGKNKEYLYIINFEEHQGGLHKRTKSKYPDPPPIKEETEDSNNFREIPGNSGKFQEIPGNSHPIEWNRIEQNRIGIEWNRIEQNRTDSRVFEKIISDLNEKAGTSFKPTTPKTKELIKARLKEGFTVEDFYRVHDNMVAAWLHDKEMSQYLRPITLYSNKFESYLNRASPPTTLSKTTIANLEAAKNVLKKIEEEEQNNEEQTSDTIQASGSCGIL